jgi:hypothetical protein
MKEFLISLLDFLGFAYWVEIETKSPQCTYYFGPFLNAADAQVACQGYVDDLRQEGAQDLTVQVLRLKPDNLTVYDDAFDPSPSPVFSFLRG